jgi:hypothetical protein
MDQEADSTSKRTRCSRTAWEQKKTERKISINQWNGVSGCEVWEVY